MQNGNSAFEIAVPKATITQSRPLAVDIDNHVNLPTGAHGNLGPSIDSPRGSPKDSHKYEDYVSSGLVYPAFPPSRLKRH